MIDFLKEHWQLLIAFIVGLYELTARLIPTVANISFIQKIIELLKWISEKLNIQKK